jgi:hypothetical protein
MLLVGVQVDDIARNRVRWTIDRLYTLTVLDGFEDKQLALKVSWFWTSARGCW